MPAAQGYIGRNPADSATVIARQSFSPTGIQTDFTFAAGYEVGYVDLYLNGARLIEGQDFTATDGSTVGLTTNAVNGDVLELVAFKAFNAANVTNAGGDFAVSQNLTVGGTAEVTGAITATGGVVGDVTGNATGLSGTPDLTIRNLTGVAATFTGILSYDDVVNVDSVGFATFRSGINVQGAGSTTTTLNVTGVATVGNNISIGDSIFHTGDGGGTTFGFPAADTFTVYTDGSERLRVTSTGNIGINETDPDQKLHILDTAAGARHPILLQNRTNGDSSVGIQFIASGSDLSDGQFATIEAQADTAGNTKHDLLFKTVANGGTPTERLRITSAGRVGIGSAIPGHNLEIMGSFPDFAISDSDTTNDKFRILHNGGGTQLMVDPNNVGPNASYLLVAVDGTERLRITSGGNVDINGTPPWTVTGGSYRNLSISGDDASSSGFLWLGNGAAATNADFDLGRVNFVNGANIVAQIKGTTQTSANDDGRISFFTKATGSSISEKLRITSDGRLKIGTISDYSTGVTNAPVYIAMQSDITGIGDDEGDTTAGMVRIEETGSNDGRYHGIELRNKNSGDIRIFNSDRSTLDRGDLILVMPDEDASDGTHLKMRVNSLNSSIQISGKGGAIAGNTTTEHTDIYIATKTGVTAVDTGVGAEVAGIIRFEDKGSNNSRYHGIEIRNRNSGDIRILNLDEGTTNKASMVFAIDNSGVTEALRLNSSGNAVFAGTVSDSIGPLRRLGQSIKTGNYTLVAGDAGTHIRVDGGHTITVPDSVFTSGDMITIVANSSSDVTINESGSLTLYNAADGSDGNVTLAARTVCTILIAEGGSGTKAYIAGGGIS